MHAAVCPACQSNVDLPHYVTSRTVKTMCPKCGELLAVPPSESRHHQDATAAHMSGVATTATVAAREIRKAMRKRLEREGY